MDLLMEKLTTYAKESMGYGVTVAFIHVLFGNIHVFSEIYAC